jgi:hypothetical protein
MSTNLIDGSAILEIAKRNGRFNVSLRWRDIPLQKKCNALVRDGLLQRVGRIKREIVYVLPGVKWEVRNGYLNIRKEAA